MTLDPDAYARQLIGGGPPESLEAFVTSPAWGGLTTASPLQRSICRDSAGHSLVVLVCGVRGGKSYLASCAALHAALTADLSHLRSHDLPRVPIIGPKQDLAEATFTQLCGIVDASESLAARVRERGADWMLVSRPDGRVVELVVSAAHGGGASVRNRWLAGFVFEEVAQFGEQATGYRVNAEELLQAARTRLVKGCQGWLISSPYGPRGLLYDLWRKHYNKSGDVLVVHAPTLAMNPDLPGLAETIAVVRAEDPDTAAREYDAEWLDVESALIPMLQLEACLRDVGTLPAEEGWSYVAAMDPGTRGNAWTLVVLGRSAERMVCVHAEEWIGSKGAPLDSAAVLTAIRNRLAEYGVGRVMQDQWAADPIVALGSRLEPKLWIDATDVVGQKRTQMYLDLAALIGRRGIELPRLPHLVADLQGLRKVVSGRGDIGIELRQTPDGRHCDFAPALALAAQQWLAGPVVTQPLTAAELEHERERAWQEALEEGRRLGEQDPTGYDNEHGEEESTWP